MRRREVRRWPRTFVLGALLTLWLGTPASAAEDVPPLARGPAASEVFSYDHRYDLAALWREAIDAGWGDEDAVILVERHDETWTGDGRRLEFHHRIVRLATELAVEAYADLRIPYDSLRTAFTVHALRTFRDGRWIESGPTAQVETTPEALDRAPDYSYRRERMLLHDGVEVPCVVETAWTIEDRAPFRGGMAGFEVFRGPDPMVQMELQVVAPWSIEVKSSGDLEAPKTQMAGESGGRRATWTARRIPPTDWLGDAPEHNFPTAHWSTWRDWPALGAALLEKFNRALTITDAQRDTLKARLRGVEVETEIARRVAALVADKTRYVDYPDDWDGSGPREAARTWETGYGTSLDRAVLAAALLNAAGLTGRVFFGGRATGAAPRGAPGLGYFRPIHLMVTKGDPRFSWIGAVDPTSSEFVAGHAEADGRILWLLGPGWDAGPTGDFGGNDVIVHSPGAPGGGDVAVSVELAYDDSAKLWTGSGTYRTSGLLNRYGEMEGLNEQAKEWLCSVLEQFLAGSTVTKMNPSLLDPDGVVAGFGLEWKLPEADARGRYRVEMGGLKRGVRSLLPSELSLQRESVERQMALPIWNGLSQGVRLRLKVPPDRFVRLPDPVNIDNEAGTFEVTVEREDEAVTITRRLQLEGRRFLPPEEWPALRALLLAEEHDRNRVLLVTDPADEADGGAAEKKVPDSRTD